MSGEHREIGDGNAAVYSTSFESQKAQTNMQPLRDQIDQQRAEQQPEPEAPVEPDAQEAPVGSDAQEAPVEPDDQSEGEPPISVNPPENNIPPGQGYDYPLEQEPEVTDDPEDLESEEPEPTAPAPEVAQDTTDGAAPVDPSMGASTPGLTGKLFNFVKKNGMNMSGPLALALAGVLSAFPPTAAVALPALYSGLAGSAIGGLAGGVSGYRNADGSMTDRLKSGAQGAVKGANRGALMGTAAGAVGAAAAGDPTSAVAPPDGSATTTTTPTQTPADAGTETLSEPTRPSPEQLKQMQTSTDQSAYNQATTDHYNNSSATADSNKFQKFKDFFKSR